MSKTSDSWSALVSNTTSGWNNSAFGIEVSEISLPDISSATSKIYSTVNSGVEQSLSYFQLAGGNLQSMFENTDQYLAVADAAGSASLNYLNSKVSRLKSLWTTQKEVTLGALIGEISPYALSPTEAGKVLASKLKDLITYLAGVQKGDTWKEVVSNIGKDAASALMTDPSFIAATSQLGAFQAFGNVLNGVATLIDTVSKVLQVLESVLPWTEITSAFALIFWSGGATAGEGTTKISEEVEKICQRLIALMMKPLKKMAFGITIKVPALLLGAMNTMSVKEAVSSYGPAAQWLQTLFDDDFYRETINSYRWDTSITKALENTMGTLENWSQFKFDNEADRGNLMKTKFLSNLVQNYMYGSNGNNGIIAQARKAAHITNYGSGTVFWGYSNSYTTNIIPASTTTIETTTNAAAAISAASDLDRILNGNSDTSPITDELAIRTISKQIYEAL